MDSEHCDSYVDRAGFTEPSSKEFNDEKVDQNHSQYSESSVDNFETLVQRCTTQLKISPGFFTKLFNFSITAFHLIKMFSIGISNTIFITSFSQLVYIFLTSYYVLFLYCSYIKRYFLKSFIAFGNFAINGALGFNFWLVTANNRPEALLSRYMNSNVRIPEFFYLGNRSTIWLPMVFWMWFQILNRNIINLLTWEYEGLIVKPRNQRLYRLYCILSPMISLCSWALLKKRLATNWLLVSEAELEGGYNMIATDLLSSPGLFRTLFFSILINTPMLLWNSFQTFQYRGIVWKTPSDTGILVFQDDAKSLLCEIS